ncbi:MAG: tRNA dimethylallyltransferase [Solirubrobacterales bacterium]|nr:tRNA dimethylallyltransferase [Solirubrobacterales bacterium]
MPRIVAIFGPTGIGKTGVSIELARMLEHQGERAIAVNCDSMQVYEGIATLSGAPTAAEQEKLEHRLVGFVPVDQEFSAGSFATRARAEIDALLEEGSLPLVVGGTGLYLRAALTDLDLRPPVSAELRSRVEADLAARGPEALHAELPERFREQVEAGDRKRIARFTELLLAGHEPAPDHDRGGALWTRDLRHPTLLAGLIESDETLVAKIDRRVEAMAAEAGAEADAALAAGASRTVRAAIGFDQFRTGDLERVKVLHRRYGRRQLTWMRRMPGVDLIDRDGRSDREVAGRILDLLQTGRSASDLPSG